MPTFQRFPATAKFNEPVLYAGRWAGNTTGNCVAVSNTGRDLTLIRSGTGAHTLAFASGSIVPTVQDASIKLHSANTNGHQLQIAPYVAGTGWTIVNTHANGVAVDLATTDEILVSIWVSYSGVP